MSVIDWSAFTRKINIKASKETIYQAWTEPNKIQLWFLKNADFYNTDGMIDPNSTIEVGNTYKWTWHASDHLAEGEVLSMNKNESLRFTFLGCEVKVHLKSENDVTLLTIEQSKIPIDEESKLSLYVECTRGWTFYMTNLKSLLEGGIDLRNIDDGINQVINT